MWTKHGVFHLVASRNHWDENEEGCFLGDEDPDLVNVLEGSNLTDHTVK